MVAVKISTNLLGVYGPSYNSFAVQKGKAPLGGSRAFMKFCYVLVMNVSHCVTVVFILEYQWEYKC